jgi:bacteriocin-like protein
MHELTNAELDAVSGGAQAIAKRENPILTLFHDFEIFFERLEGGGMKREMLGSPIAVRAKAA